MDNELLQLFRDIRPLINQEDIKIILSRKGGIHHIDALILYAYILKLNPEFVIEFSPQYGYSTSCIALALKRLGNKEYFATFELHEYYKNGMINELKKIGVHEYVDVRFGDALKEIPKYIENKKLQHKTGFVFIDSDHSEGFAQKYIETIFPLFQPKATVIVHDIGAMSNNPHGDFQETLNSEDTNAGEYKALKKYLSNNKLPYLISQSLFGGHHESSKDLPVNKQALEEVGKIIGQGIPSIGQQCSKLLIFQTKG